LCIPILMSETTRSINTMALYNFQDTLLFKRLDQYLFFFKQGQINSKDIFDVTKYFYFK